MTTSLYTACGIATIVYNECNKSRHPRAAKLISGELFEITFTGRGEAEESFRGRHASRPRHSSARCRVTRASTGTLRPPSLPARVLCPQKVFLECKDVQLIRAGFPVRSCVSQALTLLKSSAVPSWPHLHV